MHEQHPLLFYDGICGLCDRAVQFVLFTEASGKIRFAPLQGPTAAEHLPALDRSQLASLVLIKDGKFYRKADAVIQIAKYLKHPWKGVLTLLQIFPSGIRNLGYDLVARYRYPIFGKFDSCKLPAPHQRERFLP